MLVYADDAQTIKVGVIGLDNYQALAFTQLFHDPKATGDLKGFRVVAAFAGGSRDIEESVQSLPKWVPEMKKAGVKIVDSIDKVAAESDAILIMSLDGRVHLEQLKAVAKAGKPVSAVSAQFTTPKASR